MRDASAGAWPAGDSTGVGCRSAPLALGARLGALARELDRIGRSWENRLLRIKELAEGPDPTAPSLP